MTLPDKAVAPAFPFLVGCDRSGTTLLRAMLDSHSALAIPGESHFLIRLLDGDEFPSGGPFDVDRFLSIVLPHPRFVRWGLDREAVEQAVRRSEPATVSDAVRCVFAAYAASRRKARYGDKTPRYVAFLEPIARAFPEARFVHIVRDGRAVALSLLEVEWGPATLPDAAAFWRDAVTAGRRAGERLGDRYREIRYEDLVADPRATLEPVCGLLGLGWEDGMLEYHRRAGEIVAPVLAPERHRNIGRPPDPSVRDWRASLRGADLAEFERIAGDALAAFGYPVGP